MNLATTHCRASVGINAPLVSIETHLANGLPAFNIVGLAEKAVQESRDRVRSAIINSGFEFPARRITVSLAPADLPKHGSRYDLAIAIGILAASEQIPNHQLDQYEFAAELTLSAQLRPVHGVLPFALATKNNQKQLVIATANESEALLIEQSRVLGCQSLLELCAHLCGQKKLPFSSLSTTNVEPEHLPINSDMYDVIGQTQAKRALEIAAAGRHNMLMMGPPGSGKSMLASRLPSILPRMTEQEAIENAAILSIAGHSLQQESWKIRRYRQPHHTCSGVALVGGGSNPMPGEISLAHHGVLFLDEIAEFNSKVLDVLREPLETGKITLSRAARQAEYPAQFQLIAAMNPCKCGYADDPQRHCGACSPSQIKRYQGKLSGPLRDRIDIQLQIPALSSEELINPTQARGDSSATIQQRVEAAYQKQLQRQGCSNNTLGQKMLHQVCQLTKLDQELLSNAIDKLQLSARAYHRILRVARSIADLGQCEQINTQHLSEAISYRRLDRQ